MGWMPALFSIALIIIALLWYYYYAKDKVSRSGAIYHVFERLGHQRYDGLDSELRGILKEKGLREEDPFDEIVTRSMVLDLTKPEEFENVVDQVSSKLSGILPLSKKEIIQQIMDGTRVGATPVTHGVALPHFRVEGILHAYMVLVRAVEGIKIQIYNPLTQEEEDETIVNAIFFLVSPESNPAQHLRILARIAGRVDEESFTKEWINAENENELKEALLHDERFMTLTITKDDVSEIMIGKQLHEITIPQGCLVALLRREDHSIIPKGNTVLEAGDRLTIIGDPSAMKEMNKLYKKEWL
jgi:mannitol/fructose-specific phosphotransferase system IIA component (Ntr-type)